MPNIYVLAKDGTPLMPTHKKGRVRRMLKTGKARIVRHVPFTIQLTYDIKDPVVDDVVLGIDPGRTNIGMCAVDTKGCILYASDIETRNKKIAKLMLKRKQMRQASRRGERKRRQRRAIAADKTGMARHTEFWRMLPGCKKAIRCKNIRNTEAKFNNRKRQAGWLTPTARHLLETHINAVKLVMKILPVSSIVIEINRFDFARMENPGIRNWEYQKGRLFGFKDSKEAVSAQQGGKCLLCGKNNIDHYHHIEPRHDSGSDSIDNIAGLCNSCHAKIHTDPRAKEDMQTKKEGVLKKYHALSVINQIMKQLLTKLSGMMPTFVTTGYETKAIRELLSLPKDHHVDAYCIALSAIDALPEPDTFEHVYQIKQFRRHERAIIKYQRERTYQTESGELTKGGKPKLVTTARNRKPRFEQEGLALSDWFDEQVRQYGIAEARRMRSRLKVKKSTRGYNKPDRLMPGAIFLHDAKRYVMSGQLSNGQYLRAVGDTKTNYPANECRIIAQNTGLVYL